MGAFKRFEMHGNIYNKSSFQQLQRLKYVLLIYSERQCFLDFFFFFLSNSCLRNQHLSTCLLVLKKKMINLGWLVTSEMYAELKSCLCHRLELHRLFVHPSGGRMPAHRIPIGSAALPSINWILRLPCKITTEAHVQHQILISKWWWTGLCGLEKAALRSEDRNVNLPLKTCIIVIP